MCSYYSFSFISEKTICFRRVKATAKVWAKSIKIEPNTTVFWYSFCRCCCWMLANKPDSPKTSLVVRANLYQLAYVRNSQPSNEIHVLSKQISAFMCLYFSPMEEKSWIFFFAQRFFVCVLCLPLHFHSLARSFVQSMVRLGTVFYCCCCVVFVMSKCFAKHLNALNGKRWEREWEWERERE